MRTEAGSAGGPATGGVPRRRANRSFGPGRWKLRFWGLAIALLAAMPFVSWCAAAAAESTARVTFEGCEVGKPPTGWSCRNGSASSVYSVGSEGGRKFLHADARGTGVQIGRETAWSLKEFPVLEWQWRAVLFPRNGDERKKATNDSVLGLYVVFGQWPLIKAIKYVWSDVLPVGMCLESPFFSRTKIVVVESGRDREGQWVTERRDVLADFRHLFGDRETAPMARGIGLLTDADNTGSRAIGDYGDIEMLGIHEYPPIDEDSHLMRH